MPKFATYADIEAFEATPLAERNLPNSTYAAISRTAKKYPNHTALTFFLQGTAYEQSVSFSYQTLVGKLTQTANMLHDLGVGPQDTVSYILPNLPQTYFTLYGGELAGIANPINPLLEPHVIAEIMNAAKTKVLVTLAPFPRVDVWEKVSTVVDQVPTLETILQIDLAQYLTGIKKIVVNLMRLGKSKGNVRAKVLDFDKTAAKYPMDRLISGRTIDSSDIAAYFHTGGTTGTPKLAQHTHSNQVYDGWMVSEYIDMSPESRIFLGLPLFHNYGAIALAISAWSAGSAVIMASPQGFRGEGVIDNFWKIADHYDATLLAAVPTLFKALLNVPIDGSDISKLKIASCGAAPLPLELARQFEEYSGIKVLEGYGLTEGTSVSATNPTYGESRSGSIGFRYPYQEIRPALIYGSDFERFCEPNEVGVIIVRGPNVFPGYLDDYHNKGAFVDTGDGQGPWLNTGDMGRVDEDGYLWLTGRTKELIIRGGHNIDPKLIEDPMHLHPAVGLAAAIGRPDPKAGELPVVYIELKPNINASPEELLEFAQNNIGERAAIPKQIYIMDEIPLTTVGKVHKPTLVRQQVVEVFTSDLEQLDGVSSVKVDVEPDKRLGKIAYVNIQAASGADKAELEQKVREVLGFYTVSFELNIE